MECTEICDNFGQNTIEIQKFKLQMILDGCGDKNRNKEKITDKEIENRLKNMRDRINERTGLRPKNMKYITGSEGYKNTVGKIDGLRDSQGYKNDTKRCGDTKLREELLTRRDNATHLHATEKSLSRIEKSQDIVKTEMNEIKMILEQKISRTKNNYMKMSADVEEIGHLVELGRFVNNKVQRVNIKERLAKELRRMEHSSSIDGE